LGGEGLSRFLCMLKEASANEQGCVSFASASPAFLCSLPTV